MLTSIYWKGINNKFYGFNIWDYFIQIMLNSTVITSGKKITNG